MKNIQESTDVFIAGGGTAGHTAAIQAARAGIKTTVIEAGTMLGGTMTSGGVYMPNRFYSTEGPAILRIPWEVHKKCNIGNSFDDVNIEKLQNRPRL